MATLTSALECLQLTNASDHGQMVQKIRVGLLSHETCFKWLFQAVLARNLQDRLMNLKLSFQKEHAVLNEDDDNACRNSLPLISIAKLLLVAHVNMLSKDEDAVQLAISKCHKLVNSCMNNQILSPEHIEGLQYLLKMTDIACAVNCQEERIEKDEVLSFGTDIDMEGDLILKSRVAVIAVHQYVLSILGSGFEQQALDLAEEIRRQDPDCGEWHYCVFLRCRALRKAMDPTGTVWKKELEAIVDAVGCSDVRLSPVIWIEFLKCLCEVLRYRSKGKTFAQLQVGDIEFRTAQQLVDYIRKTADDIIAMDTTSDAINIEIADVFSSVIAPQFRDMDFAKACLKRALMFHPESANVLYKLTVFYAQQGFFDKAEKRLSQALDLDQQNFSLILLYVKILMRGMLQNYEKLKDLFSTLESLSTEYESTPENFEFLLTKAVYKLLCGRYSDFVILVVRTAGHPGFSTQMKSTLRDANRFDWGRNMPGRSLTEEMLKAVGDNDKGDCKARSNCAKVLQQILEQKNQPQIDELPLSASDSNYSDSRQIKHPHLRSVLLNLNMHPTASEGESGKQMSGRGRGRGAGRGRGRGRGNVSERGRGVQNGGARTGIENRENSRGRGRGTNRGRGRGNQRTGGDENNTEAPTFRGGGASRTSGRTRGRGPTPRTPTVIRPLLTNKE